MPVYENLVVTAFMQNNLFWAGKLQKQLERNVLLSHLSVVYQGNLTLHRFQYKSENIE